MRLPSGVQAELRCGDLAATVTEVGATLRSFTLAGEPVIWGFSPDEMCSGARGQVLVPWPNRIGDGRYRFAGRDLHLPVDDHVNGCAIHGLLRWRPWSIEQPAATTASCRAVLDPQPGYPFQLEVRVTYELSDDGLRLRVDAGNLGAAPLPFGLGFHPYLDPGAGGLERATLALPASQRLVLDPRGLPTGVLAPLADDAPAGAGGEDFPGLDGRTPLEGIRLDDCFTRLRRDADGRWRARLLRAAPDPAPGSGSGSGSGSERRGGDLVGVELWADEAFGYCQVYTGDTLAPPNRRRAVAVEPMTCPPGALASGAGLLVLGPGERFSGELGVSPVR